MKKKHLFKRTLASKALNGRMFRCIITDSSGNSVISEARTLTVE